MPQQRAELENITGNGQQAVTACMKYASLGCKYDGLKPYVKVPARLAKKRVGLRWGGSRFRKNMLPVEDAGQRSAYCAVRIIPGK